MDRAVSLEARRIDLSLEPPFHLGRVGIDPPAHEIRWPGGCRRLQPQTVKVLVALHDKIGQVVTRDELVDRCWDGRFVGEDVINRCISLLRRVAAESGGIEIETVPRGGYRLIEAQPSRSSKANRSAFPQLLGVKLHSAAAIAALGLVLVTGPVALVVVERATRPTADAVMLKPFDVVGDAALARTFAGGVSDDVDRALSAAGVNVVDPDASGRSAKAAFVLSGRAELPGSDLHLTAQLQDARDHALLWSTSFTRPANQLQAMQEQVAENLAAVLQCALDTSHQRGGVQLDQDTIKLYLKACALQQSVEVPSDQIEVLLSDVTARQPRFAVAWARLALYAANAAWGATPQQAAALRREARNAAQAALRLDPKSGVAYEALTDMELGRVPFAQLHREFQKVLSFDPNDASIVNDDGELLMRMGRLDDGLQMFRRGVELDPLSPSQVADLIKGLIDDSRNSEVEDTLQRAVRVWPDDKMLKFIHLDYEARFGSPDAARSILNDPDARPQVRDVTLEIYRRLIDARQSNRLADRRAFIAWLEKEVASEQVDVGFAVPMIAGFGDVDGAFKLAFAAPTQIPENAPDPAFLWEPDSINLRRDPRFVALAAKFHVADFWRATQLWPDFCSTTDWPYSCKPQGARAKSTAPGQPKS